MERRLGYTIVEYFDETSGLVQYCAFKDEEVPAKDRRNMIISLADITTPKEAVSAFCFLVRQQMAALLGERKE